jgi:hypothetical protein
MDETTNEFALNHGFVRFGHREKWNFIKIPLNLAISTFFSPLKYGEFGGIFSKKLFCTRCRPSFFFWGHQVTKFRKKTKPWSQFQLFRI